MKILAIYRGTLEDYRGTPIRVRHLLRLINEDKRVDLTVASWDKTSDKFKKHIFLNNNHFEDINKISKYVKENKINVIIGHTASAIYYLTPLKFLTKAKIVLEIHGFIEDEARAYNDIGLLKYWLLKIYFGLSYFLYDLITTCSQSVTDICLKYNKNSVTLCGGVDLSLFNPNAKSGHYFKKDNRIVIGYAGNARVWQGVDFLVEAYKDLLKKTDDFRLILLMSERSDLVKGIEVIAPLPYEDVSKFLIDCDILVIPRPLTPVTKISIPSKIIEYLAMGKPVVASPVGDMDKIIVSGENGMLYAPSNKEEFQKCLLYLRDKDIRTKIGDKARETVQNMSWEILAKNLIDFIKEKV